MHFKLFAKKASRYISCAVKYSLSLAVAPFVRNRTEFKDLWLISERGVDARDNGYYLFKYITKNHPQINIAYVITKDSSDRERVEKLGRLIDHNSFKHFLALAVSKVKISSHIMGYTPYIDFFVRADKMRLVKGKKVFLQHGITKDNLTYLYNNNVNIDLFVCSARPEYEYINSNFGYEDGVVQMLGLCRYDDLYKIEERSKKILVMPTWRYNLRGTDRKGFLKSRYFKTFDSLLKSERLKDLLAKYDYELLFYPHIELQKYVDCFSGSDRVKIMSFKDTTVQNLLINTDVLITDFSSVFFDYGYMEKPMIFYQFDEKEFRSQHYSEGYFSYRRDAFGEVVTDENDVLAELENILSSGCKMDKKYLDKVSEFFELKDRNNSERNFYAIKEIADR